MRYAMRGRQVLHAITDLSFHTVDLPLKEPFETAYMAALYQLGYDSAVKGYPWDKAPPGFTESKRRGKSVSCGLRIKRADPVRARDGGPNETVDAADTNR